MERSPRSRPPPMDASGAPLRPLQAAIALSDLAARLALPAAVLGLARGAAQPALVAAAIASAAAIVRGFSTSRAVRRSLVGAWERAVAGARARAAADLARRREDEESVAALIDGVHEQATFEAVLLPQIVGIAGAALGVAVASVFVMGPLPALAGGALLAALGALVAVSGRGLRRAQREAWEGFGRLARDMRVLVEGALELRAAGREGGAAEQVLRVAAAVADSEARATAASSRMAILPASLALLAVAAPLEAGVAWVERALGGPRLFEATVLGGAAVSIALSAARAWESWVATEPRRARFRAFAACAGAPPAQREAPPSDSLAEVPIQIAGISHDWSGDGSRTPDALDLTLLPREGVALMGPNGSGKTTAALALLGVVRPTSGAVRIGGIDASRLDRAALAGRIAYVPQDPLLVAGETIAWHCALHEDAPPGADAVDRALLRVGLTGALSARARARGVEVRDLPASELSGGERRRLALARALARPRELYVLDEPEAGLDVEARAHLATLLADLTAEARVVLVAHDPSAVPPSFRRVAVTGARGRAVVTPRT